MLNAQTNRYDPCNQRTEKGDIWMKMPKIAAHRGCAAGNIPCNTWIAFEAALAAATVHESAGKGIGDGVNCVSDKMNKRDGRK